MGGELNRDILSRLTEKRRDFLVRSGEFEGGYVPFARLSLEYFQNYQKALREMTQQFLRTFPDPNNPFYSDRRLSQMESVYADHPNFLEYSYYHNRLLNDFLKAQELNDYFDLRDTLTRFHLYDLFESVSTITNVMSGALSIAGVTSHQTNVYQSYIEELPDVIYNGDNVPNIIKEDKDSLKTFRRNWDLKHHRHYLDEMGNGHYLNNFNRLIPANEILGFVFYEDPSIINKLVIF